MIPDWVLPAKSELGDDIDFIVNCVPGIDDELKKEFPEQSQDTLEYFLKHTKI